MISRSRHVGPVCLVALLATTTSVALGQGTKVAPPIPRPITSVTELEGTSTVVTIAGRSSVNAGQLQSTAFDIAIQDETGGIRVFARALRLPVHEGDSVIATGTIRRYRGDLELVASRASIVSVLRRTIAPRDVPIDVTTMSRYPGQLVRVHGRVTGFGHSEGGQWIRLRDGSNATQGTITVWVPANHGAPVDLSHVQSDDSLTVSGIVTSYKDNEDEPIVWQLVPRSADDVILSAARAKWPAWLAWAVAAIIAIIGAAFTLVRLHSRRQLRAFRETDARYRQLLALTPEAVLVHAEGRILFTNPATAELLGVPNEQELVGKPIADFVPPESRDALNGLGVDAGGGRTPRVRGRLITSSQGPLDVEIASSPCVYNDKPAVVVLARDITAQIRYERDLQALALIDELTGLHNRRGFSLFADQELARARRHGRIPTLLFADLDDLKTINDVHGHASGDVALKLVASALKSILRESDIVARWSGDEFVALLSDGDLEAASRIDERLATAISAQTPPHLPYRVSATVGTSTLDPLLALRDAMERADAELYNKKKHSRRDGRRPTPENVDVAAEPE
ncbi:MAG TPA: diguanylate cyclase [Gemmatimonadaceae bacterium]|jgi:diguanylate cyclase (GGDEF)-like protein/PAS domain S-box-containing protein|nr:diguanylate cyclase [Gemmatimonadaceae bacterium]